MVFAWKNGEKLRKTLVSLLHVTVQTQNGHLPKKIQDTWLLEPQNCTVTAEGIMPRVNRSPSPLNVVGLGTDLGTVTEARWISLRAYSSL
jgi:hypothetical protein